VALIAGPGHAKRAIHSHDLARGPSGPAVGPTAGAPLVPPVSPSLQPASRPARLIHQRPSGHVVASVRSARSTAAAPTVGAAQRELGFERTPRPQTRAAPQRGAASEFAPG
jgi:hypothetical protein